MLADDQNGLKEKHYSKKRVKRNVIHLLYGRLVTSIASVAVSLIIIRELSVEDYAHFTGLIGLVFLIMVISGFGIDRAIMKFMPELKQKDRHNELTKVTTAFLSVRVVSTTIFILIFLYLYEEVLNIFNIELSVGLVYFFSIYVFLEIMLMHLRGSLQALLLHKIVALGTVIEWFLKLSLLVWFINQPAALNLSELYKILILSMVLVVIIYVYYLYKFLLKLEHKTVLLSTLKLGNITRFSFHNYLQSLSGAHVNPAVSRLVASSLMSQGTVATIGFAYALTESVKRYLPSRLFIGLIEPVVLAKYSEDKDFNFAIKLVVLSLKLNFFIVFPVLFWLLASGEGVLGFISGDKYGESAWIISALFIVVLLDSGRLMLQLICNAVDESLLLVKSNLISYIPFTVWLGLTAIYELKGFLIGLILVFLFRNYYLMSRLKRKGFVLEYDIYGLFKILLISAMSSSLASILVSHSVLSLVTMSLVSFVLTILFYLVFSFLIKPFTEKERDQINGLLGKRIFVW